MSSFLLSLLVDVEIALFILGVFTVLRKEKRPLSESLSFAIVIVLAFYSISIQLFLYLRAHESYWEIDLLVLLWSLLQIGRNLPVLRAAFAELRAFLRAHRAVTTFCFCLWSYLLVQAFVSPPMNVDTRTYHLARVLLFMKEHSFHLQNASNFWQQVYPWGYDILYFLHLRFFSDFGLGVFAFLMYLVVVLGTYSVVKQHFANERLGLVTAFIVGSMTELVCQATNHKNDIPLAAMAVTALLAAQCHLSRRKPADLLLLGLACVFGASSKPSFLLFAAPFLAVYAVLLIWRHDFFSTMKTLLHPRLLTRPEMWLLAGLIAGLTLHYSINVQTYGHPFGPPGALQFLRQADGLEGALSNGLRYFLLSAEVPRGFGGDHLNGWLNAFLGTWHDLGLGRSGSAESGVARRTALLAPSYGWYGPLSFLLVWPALLWAALFGRGLPRAVAVSMLVFFAIACYTLSWTHYSGRYFSLFFCGSGLCIAFTFQRALEVRVFRRTVYCIAAATMLYGASFNWEKSVIPHQRGGWVYRALHRNINYDYYNQHLYAKDIVDTFSANIGPRKRVLLLAQGGSMIFEYLLKRPDLKFTVSNGYHLTLDGQSCNLAAPGELERIAQHFDYLYCINFPGNRFDRVSALWNLNRRQVFRLNVKPLFYNGAPPEISYPKTWFALYRLRP